MVLKLRKAYAVHECFLVRSTYLKEESHSDALWKSWNGIFYPLTLCFNATDIDLWYEYCWLADAYTLKVSFLIFAR